MDDCTHLTKDVDRESGRWHRRRRGRKGLAAMTGNRVPAVLRHRLEDDATFGLIELLDRERKDWSEQVLSVAADRFERQLTEDISGLRVEFRTALHDGLSAVRTELHDGLTAVRTELHDGLTAVRKELHDGLTAVRAEVLDGLTAVRTDVHGGVNSLRQEVNSLRQEMATTRVEMLKWSFLFWIGQVAAMAGLFAVMFKMTGR
jgi:hypothetical protein